MSRALFLGTGADEGPDGRYRTSVDPMAHIILVLAVLTVAGEARVENLAVTIGSTIAPVTPLAIDGQKRRQSRMKRIARYGVALLLFMKVASCTSRILTVCADEDDDGDEID